MPPNLVSQVPVVSSVVVSACRFPAIPPLVVRPPPQPTHLVLGSLDPRIHPVTLGSGDPGALAQSVKHPFGPAAGAAIPRRLLIAAPEPPTLPQHQQRRAGGCSAAAPPPPPQRCSMPWRGCPRSSNLQGLGGLRLS